MTLQALPGFDVEAKPVEERPSYQRRLTARFKALLASGRHPATGLRLLPEGLTCNTCVHRGGRSPYFKCDLVRATHSPVTDIRLSWPACIRYAARALTEAS